MTERTNSYKRELMLEQQLKVCGATKHHNPVWPNPVTALKVTKSREKINKSVSIQF